MMIPLRVLRLGVLLLAIGILGAAAPSMAAEHHATRQVVVPKEDRFTPFALTIHAGDTVQWVNNDTDDHTVVSDNAFNTAGHNDTNQVLPGTTSNGGRPGRFSLRFTRAGTFVYYCRFHAHLDSANQPVAPGPDGGIQESNGNFGTPMMGVITVLPGDD